MNRGGVFEGDLRESREADALGDVDSAVAILRGALARQPGAPAVDRSPTLAYLAELLDRHGDEAGARAALLELFTLPLTDQERDETEDDLRAGRELLDALNLAHLERKYSAPPLTPRQAEQLARVPTSHDGALQYAPSQVTLASGEVLPRVFIVEEAAFYRLWGTEPDRAILDISTVVAIEDSPHRLPDRLADEIYAGHESGMGYYVFTVQLRNGTVLPFLTGDAVDFPDWPPGVDPRDAVAVTPHAGRNLLAPGASNHGAAPSVWCLYRG